MSLPAASPEPVAPKPRPLYRDFTVLQTAVLVLLLDQLTKYLVIQSLAPGFSFPFRGFFRITHVHNTGSAFGILQGLNTPLIFVSFIGIVILVLIYRSQQRPSNWLRLSLALQLGGAFGNLIDRIRLGYVTDFIDIGPWPVFNLADASIVSGLTILAWVLTRKGPPRKQPMEQPVEQPAEKRGEQSGEQMQPAATIVTGCGPADGGPREDPESGSVRMVIPLTGTIQRSDPEPEVDATSAGQRETPPAGRENSQECPARPEIP
jgi:signal peptidase II